MIGETKPAFQERAVLFVPVRVKSLHLIGLKKLASHLRALNINLTLSTDPVPEKTTSEKVLKDGKGGEE